LNLTSGFNILHMIPSMEDTEQNKKFLSEKIIILAKELETIGFQITVEQNRKDGYLSLIRNLDESKLKFRKSIN
jgi:hypothetical protein